MGGFGGEDRVFGDGLGRSGDGLPVGGDPSRRDGRLGPRATVEQSALDEQEIDAFSRLCRL
jgi:hypothetical protein